ncbi:MAG: glycosyltransferase family 39 protein [Calothrix sp. SM1_5_4]|nr:glycosyltransferase family 39 protein [Calothrix sp. SM1_5_4]
MGEVQSQRLVRVFFLGAGVLLVWRFVLLYQLGLGDDEAYYSDWGRHLALSYFDHPPLVGWITGVFQRLSPGAEWAVRWPFVALTAGTAWGLFRLARRLGDNDAAIKTWIILTLLPLYSFGGFMAFPDIPFLAAWVWALNVSLRIEESPERISGWLQLGCATGLVILSKLSGVILLASIFLWMVSSTRLRAQFRTSRPWLGLALTLAIVLPVIVWNVENGFPTIRFQFWERHHSGGLSFRRWLLFLLSQALVLSPLALILVVRECFTAFGTISRPVSRWLLSFSLPAVAVFFIQPLFSQFMVHWTAPAYLPLLAAISWSRARVTAFNWVYLMVVNILFLAFCSFPVVSAVQARWPLLKNFKSKHDISNDFYGGTDAGSWIKELKSRTEEEAYFLTSRYQLAGWFSFYSGIPVSAVGMRANAYRYFPDSPYNMSWAGRTVIFLADNRYDAGPGTIPQLWYCESLGTREVRRHGYHARTFMAWRCQWHEEI